MSTDEQVSPLSPSISEGDDIYEVAGLWHLRFGVLPDRGGRGRGVQDSRHEFHGPIRLR